MDNTFDFHAPHANISPRTWCQKLPTLSVGFVSGALNLDPKTYHGGHTLRFSDGPYGYNFLKLAAGTLSFYG